MFVTFRSKAIAFATVVLGATTLNIAPASADTFREVPGGYVQAHTGSRGESFVTQRSYRYGRSFTSVDRHDGIGPVPFVAPPAERSEYSASVYDPDRNQTRTRVTSGGRSVDTIEEGNKLFRH
jgi:hypothetical protein